jgi:hypothetical protein
VVEQEVARHQGELAFLGERDELLHLVATHRRRLLDEDVFAGLERLLRERVVARHGRRDHDRLDFGVREQVPELVGDVGVRVATRELLPSRGIDVAERSKIGEFVEVADEVLAPVAEPGHCDPHAHSFQTLSELRPSSPVALRRSTTSSAWSTSAP